MVEVAKAKDHSQMMVGEVEVEWCEVVGEAKYDSVEAAKMEEAEHETVVVVA